MSPISNAAQNVGQGALSVATLSRWLLPAAALIAAAILLTGLARRTGATK